MTSSTVSGSAHNFAAGPKWHCRTQCVDAKEACSKTITLRAFPLPSTRRLVSRQVSGKKGNRPPRGLRRYLVNLLGDLAVNWNRRGFRRGHVESDKQGRDGRVPHTIRYDATRDFFTDNERTVHLKSTFKKKRRK